MVVSRGAVRYNGTLVRTVEAALSTGWHMQDLDREISGLPSLDGRPVVDQTGLKRLYAVKIDFDFGGASFGGAAVGSGKPDIRTAEGTQLGL